jgi:hypothetical protein
VVESRVVLQRHVSKAVSSEENKVPHALVRIKVTTKLDTKVQESERVAIALARRKWLAGRGLGLGLRRRRP